MIFIAQHVSSEHRRSGLVLPPTHPYLKFIKKYHFKNDEN
ncbi:hypothetical protein SFRURICE_020405 [Spodoptera frugiperda]|nr:hypothetical protein SFRURICE_020405 [Spodoptera frugiperda]